MRFITTVYARDRSLELKNLPILSTQMNYISECFATLQKMVFKFWGTYLAVCNVAAWTPHLCAASRLNAP
jgi:hypothetical protein